MNTTLGRRLALGDRVIWMNKDDCRLTGPGTIIHITAHQVEVLWEGETARRYRRAQLYKLRHVKLISAERSLDFSAVNVCGSRVAERADDDLSACEHRDGEAFRASVETNHGVSAPPKEDDEGKNVGMGAALCSQSAPRKT